MEEVKYEDLLLRMQEVFQDVSGFSADSISDLGIRFKVLAGELYRITHAIEWLHLQAFPQTATNLYLDMHAEQRGLWRKKSVNAEGTLSFSRTVASGYDISIPKGTICSLRGNKIVEYETVEQAVLLAGRLAVQVKAQAVSGGANGNAAVGVINVLVMPPVGIEMVTNSLPFIKGEDSETDVSLRRRLLAYFEKPSNGANPAFYQNLAQMEEGVSSAMVIPRFAGTGTVGVYIWGEGAPPSAHVVIALQEKLNALREINVNVLVMPAEAIVVDVYVHIKQKPGCSFAEASAQSKVAAQRFFSELVVGSHAYKAEIGTALMQNAPITNYYMSTFMNDIYSAKGKIPIMGAFSATEALG